MVENKNIKIDKILDAFNNYISIFDGKNCESALKGYSKNSFEYERYQIAYSNNFSFLKHFIDEIEISMKTLPKKSEQLNGESGYVLPSIEDIQKFTNKNKIVDNSYLPILNRSDDAIQGFFLEIKENIQQNRKMPRQRVQYVTGKVGSGKSTFIDYFNIIYNEEFQNSNILNIIVKYEDLKLEKFYEEHKDQNLNETEKEKYYLIHVKKIFLKKIFEKYLPNINDDFFEDNIDEVERDVIENFMADPINTIEEKVEYFEQIVDNSFERTVKYICRTEGYAILISLDGFDKLNPILIQEFNSYIKFTKNLIYEDIFTNITFYYIVTLRNCTFEEFERANVTRNYLIPPNTNAIIKRTISYLASKNDFYKKFEEQFIELFDVILNQLEENLRFDDDS